MSKKVSKMNQEEIKQDVDLNDAIEAEQAVDTGEAVATTEVQQTQVSVDKKKRNWRPVVTKVVKAVAAVTALVGVGYVGYKLAEGNDKPSEDSWIDADFTEKNSEEE